MKRIMFVCTGNTCRSPMAEGLFRLLASKAGLPVEVRSAGVAAMDGMPMSEHARTVLRSRDIADEVVAESISPEALVWPDLILTMTTQHKRELIHRYPEILDKVYTLKEFVKDVKGTANEEEHSEALLAEVKLKQALSEPLTLEEQQLLSMWWLQSDDVADPFGGTLAQYEATAEEIEEQLLALIDWLQAKLN